ncbi:MAG: aminotransferase class I/II-fold pyridoxal phosphate-dependent enzyme [Polyangiaceae bacterium]
MPTHPVSDLLRPELSEYQAYVPHPGNYAVRLDANEAPPLLSQAARARLLEVAAKTSFERYPDASVEALRQALATHSGVTPAEVLVGVGSDELIALLLSALSQPRAGTDAPVVLTTTPSFVMYAMSARLRGQRVLEVPLDANWDLSSSGIAAAARVAEPSVVFIASPNNPTGNKMSLDRLAALIEALPRSLVIVDEAYVDYSDQNQLELYRRYPNVGVLRTLSKIGFAGLRVGWLIAAPELVQELDKIRPPYNMCTLSQELARVAVSELGPEIARTVASVVAERSRVATSPQRSSPGLSLTPSQANFLWVRSEKPAETAVRESQDSRYPGAQLPCARRATLASVAR